MKEQILKELKKIEETEQVKIIFAAEGGSRAYGTNSETSDYDVRFIYVKRPEDYLRLNKSSDVIEWKKNDIMDISGWDLQKALKLLHNSNSSLFELFSSPIIYISSEASFLLKELLPEYFSTGKVCTMYWHLSKRIFNIIKDQASVEPKKYLLILRGLLSAKWICEKQSFPPISFESLVDSELKDSLQDEVRYILDLKRNHPEKGTIPPVQAVNDYILKELEEIKMNDKRKGLDDKKYVLWEPLNQIFLTILKMTYPISEYDL